MKRIVTTFISVLTALVIFGLTPLETYAQQDPSSEKACRGYGCADEETLRNLGIYFTSNPDACAAPDLGGPNVGTIDAGSNTGTWVSGLQPPFILEQFMIELLKNIAHKKGTDPAKAVTEEHVIALVAFAIGEGGDINNRFLFNPLNTGIKAPDLLAPGWEHNQSGLQAFKSFDAGVEANARVMTNKNQSRMGEILTKQDSTAEQFMEAVTYFSRYPGNKLWAEASLPPNQEEYFQQRLELVRQVRNTYAQTAGLVIGTKEFEFRTKRIMPSKLKFKPSSSSNNATDSNFKLSNDSDAECNNSANTTVSTQGAKAIVELAEKLAWHDGRKGLTPTPAYDKAIRQYNKLGFSSYKGADCGAFVATVVKMTVDKKYPGLGTSVQLGYVQEQHGKKWDVKKLGPGDSTKDLIAGDVLIVRGTSGVGHTYLYTGPHGKFDAAAASFGSYMPTYNHTYLKDSRGYYTRARLLTSDGGLLNGGNVNI
jgi:hypothetical protein